MNIRITQFIVTMAIATSLPSTQAAEVPANMDGKPVTSKITDVTVYADRARVTRIGTVNLPAGADKIAFVKLPGWIDEGSVRISIVPPHAAELLDVQVLKTFLARPDDEAIRKAETAVQEMADQVAALDDEKHVLDAKEAQINSIRVFSLDKLPKDAATREIKMNEYAGVVAFVSESLLDVAKAKRELEKKRRELQPEWNARQRKLNELRQRAQLEQRTVVVSLKSDTAKNATLALTYMVPGATWEPTHELRADNDARAVTLASFGVVTQTTGEDWDGATISLSTQRTTDTIRIPELEALLVGRGRSLARVVPGGSDTFGVASANFEGQFKLWNTNANPQDKQKEFEDNWERNKVRQARIVEIFTALQQQRGTSAHFAGTGAQTIRSDGRPVRVPIGLVQLDAKPRTIAVPELSLNAANVVDLINTGKQPLLPGKTLLYVGGAFLGATETEFVAQGETFPMFLGVADQIKLSRVLDKKNSSISWSGRRKRMQVAYAVTMENLADKLVRVDLADRVPVSETDEIRILNIRITPTAKPDNKGLVKWEVTLAAKEKREFRLEYALDYAADLAQIPPAPAEGTPIMSGEHPQVPLKAQIYDLEQKLK